LLVIALAIGILGVLTPVALAQVEPENPVADFLGAIGDMVPPAFVIAFMTSMLGYLRNTPPEEFAIEKFLTTLIMSILIGVVTSLTGWDYTTVQTWLANAGITVWAYWLMKVIGLRLGWITTTTPN